MLVKETPLTRIITFASIYAQRIGVPNFIKQIPLDMRGQRDPDLILIHDFNVSLSPRGMLSRQRINEYT